MLVLHAGIDLGGFTWARTKKGVILEKLLNVCGYLRIHLIVHNDATFQEIS